MMFIDAIWMGVLSWYIAKIWPSEFGTHQPFYFLCLPSYWMSCCGINLHKNTSTICLADQDKGLAAHEVAVEPVTDNLERQVQDGTCVNIINLYKVFKTRNGDKVAVDGLNLTMYSGQVTALLGHNGAGKVSQMTLFHNCDLLLITNSFPYLFCLVSHGVIEHCDWNADWADTSRQGHGYH